MFNFKFPIFITSKLLHLLCALHCGTIVVGYMVHTDIKTCLGNEYIFWHFSSVDTLDINNLLRTSMLFESGKQLTCFSAEKKMVL